MMSVQIFIVLFVAVLIPAFLLAALWRGTSAGKFEWLLKVLYTGAYLAFVFLTGPWDWLSYYLRYLMLGLYVLAVIVSFRKVRNRPFFITSASARWRSNAGPILELLVGIGLLAFMLRGYFYSPDPVRLTFPLRDGYYYVRQGGNVVVLNNHNPSQSQRYALDIVALNGAGLRADGIYPNELEQYEIYEVPVYSPCNGQVQSVVDGFPDLIPPRSDPEHPAGNHVVIACEGANVVLAHLQNGSVAVTEGEMVTTGKELGLVGNSGNTSEPHLHIHAVEAGSTNVLEGDGIPMVFDGKFLVRNSVFVK